MQQDFFYNEEENLALNTTKKPSNYFDSQAAEFLAKSFFSYQKCEIFSAGEGNHVDFLIKHNNKYIGIQVKSSTFKKDRNKYQFQTCRNGRKTCNYSNYPYKDVQIFVLVANDLKKIYLAKNEEQTSLTLKREDFFRFEDNKENFLNQIFNSLEQSCQK